MTGLSEIDLPVGYQPSPLARYLLAVRPGRPCRVELYDGTQADARVQRYAVRYLKPGHYRGLVLRAGDTVTSGELRGIESDRDTVRAWLTSEGVPCVRIGSAK